MPTIRVYRDEFYPYYGIARHESTTARELELSDDDLRFIQDAQASWQRAKDLLATAWKKNKR